MTMWRIFAWILFTAAFLSMIALLVGVLPAFHLLEYLPITLAGLGVAAILIHDDRKGNFRD